MMPFRPLRRQRRWIALNPETMNLIRNIERTIAKLLKEVQKRGGNASEIREMKRRTMRKNFQYYECLFKISATLVIHCQLDVSLANQLFGAWQLLYSYQYIVEFAEDREEIMTHFVDRPEIPPQFTLDEYVHYIMMSSKDGIYEFHHRKEQLEEDWKRIKCNPQGCC